MLGADPDDLCLIVHYEPTLGSPGQIDDRIALGPRGEIAAVNGIGRLLRILRAGRVQAPKDPYALASHPEDAAALINRCRGARVRLNVARRFERVLTVWTDAGVDRIREVVDFGEDHEGLWVRRTGGRSVLRIPRRTLIRFASSALNLRSCSRAFTKPEAEPLNADFTRSDTSLPCVDSRGCCAA